MSDRTTGEWGITEEDRNRMQTFASMSAFDRSPEDLSPAEEADDG